MTIFAFAGTDLWWCTAAGSVWFLSAVTAVGCTTLALGECFGRRRGWFIGIVAACAMETRLTLLPALALYPYLMLGSSLSLSKSAIRALTQYVLILIGWLLVYVGYNEARWGTINDIGYDLFCRQDASCANGLFGLQYLGYELYSYFMRAPELIRRGSIAQFPYLAIDHEGVALTFTSPGLIVAWWSSTNREKRALWLTTVLVALPNFLYYVDGLDQIGMRHALDFEPFLFALMAFAVRDYYRRWFLLPIWISIAAGAWGVWYWLNYPMVSIR
jgi:hypothetical protein